MANDEATRQPADPGLNAAARRAFRLAGRVLLIERAWPPLVWALAVAILFLAASWLGLWLFAPRAAADRRRRAVRGGRAGRAGAAGKAALAGRARHLGPARPRRRGEPSSGELARRQPRQRSRRPGHPRAVGGASGAARPLGRGDPRRRPGPAHGRARPLRAAVWRGASRPGGGGRRPDPSSTARFAAAFDWRGGDAAAAAAASRIDAWIDPPPYAGRPPVMIDFKTATRRS